VVNPSIESAGPWGNSTSFNYTWIAEWAVEPLPMGAHYGGPQGRATDECQCSTIVYQLVSACADCQNRTFLSYVADLVSVRSPES
jgi:hypothetical protein